MSSGTPTSRPVFLAYVALALLVVTVLIGMAELLRQDHGPTSPLTPAVEGEVDYLRQEVVCPLAEGREGEEREAVLIDPELTPEVTSNQLYDCPQTWDGRRIRYAGEVVGALLGRNDAVWAQLNDDVYADAGAPLPTHRDFRGGNAGIGVLLTTDMADAVTWIGGPAQHGDVMEVIGRFQRVDNATGEVAIIRAEQAQVVRDGRAVEIPVSRARPIIAVLAALMATVMTVAERRARTRR